MDISQLKKIQSNLQKVNKSLVEQYFEDELLANEETIVDHVKKRWDVGERPNGGIIGTYRSPEYASFKYAINPQAGGNVDLTVTRALRNGLTLFPLGNASYKIFSTDKKAALIADKYGDDVYDLSQKENEKEVNSAASGTHERIAQMVGL